MLGYAVRAKQKPKKSKSKPRPKPAPAPQIRRPEFTGRLPRAPKPKPPTKREVKQAKAQERSYGSPAVSDRMARDNKRTAKKNKARRERLLMQARRRKYFPKDALKGAKRSQRSAIEALSDLRAQDPEKYERKQRSWLSNAARDVGDYLEGAAREGSLGDRDGFRKRLSGDAGRGIERGLQSAGEAVKRANATANKSGRLNMGLDVPVVDKLSTEAIDIAANAPTGAYMTADALASAARGKTGKLKKMAKEFEKSSAFVPLVKGDLKEAGKRASERPLTTFLEASGAKAILGRGGGAAMRRGPSKRLRRVASTQRAPQRYYTPNESKPRLVKGKVPVGGKRGPAREREYSRDVINKGLQVAAEKVAQRRGRDPNVDYGARLRPGGPRWRRGLDREVDRQVFSASRTAELHAREAAKRARKAEGAERAQLLLAARADKIRLELREAARLTTSKQRKRALIALTNLTDRKLIARVEHGAAPRMKKSTTRQSPYSRAEQLAAVKAIDRRARRGKPLGPQLTAALKDASARHVKRDVAARRSTNELPGATLARAIAEINGARRVPGVGDRRAKPRADEPSALIPEDFGGFFETARHSKRIPPKRVQGDEGWRQLAALRATDDDATATAVARAMDEHGAENLRLRAEEFGIPVGKRGYVTSHGAAERQAHKVFMEDGTDLVPLRVAKNKYVLQPRHVAERFDRHADVDAGPSSPIGKGFDAATRTFKDVVLTTSSPSRWLGGNVADIGLRSLNEGSGFVNPFDMWRGHQVGKAARGEGVQGQQAWANLTGGGLHGIADDLARLGPPIGGKANVPAHVWRAWKAAIYKTEHAVERLAQTGMVGKAYRRENQRQINSLRGLLQLEKQSLEDFGKGIAGNRALEAKVAKQVEDMIGRWGKVSPGMRRTLSLAPFAQWLGAATRYVYVTLPVHHPIKTGILAGIMQMTEPERQALGLSYFLPPSERAPDYQMGTVPTNVMRSRADVERYIRENPGLPADERDRLLAAIKHGPVVRGNRTARMTSFGTAANPGDWAGFALPQLAGAFDAMSGSSFTGEQLQYPGDYPEEYRDLPLDLMDRLPVAAGAAIEGSVPFASAFRRIFLEGGQPSEPYSTILTPSVRRRYDYDTDTYVEPKGSLGKGFKRWISPIAPEGRIYTLGAQRDIDATQKALRKITQWNKERARTPSHVDPWDADATPAAKKEGQHVDPWGEQPKKRKRPRAEMHVDPWATP